jgi:hypothetical protein
VAANITQQAFCRLDQVVLTFATLHHRYSQQNMADDPDAQGAILASIEKRWEKADQEVFIASVLVNPFYRTSCFRPLSIFQIVNIQALFRRLWIRFFPDDPVPTIFADQVLQFLDTTGIFANLGQSVDWELASALTEVCHLSHELPQW